MSDHEFEKRVQQKMGELKLRPSDAVWTEVEKNIRHNKRRRRFIFWLPVFFLFLATSAYVLYTTNQPSAPIAQSTPTVNTNTTSASTNKNAHIENNSTHNLPSTDTHSTTPVAETHPQQEQTTATGQPQQPVTIPGQKNGQVVTAPSPVNQPVVTASEPDVQKTTTATSAKTNGVNHSRYTVAKNGNTPKRYRNKQVPVAPGNTTRYNTIENYNTADNHTLAEQPNELAFTMPQTIPQEGALIATDQAAPHPFNSADVASLSPEKQKSPAPLPASSIQRQKGPKWQFGMQFNVGYSRISTSSLLDLKGLLGAQEKYKAENLASPAPQGYQLSGNQLNATQPAVKDAAPIRPDLAYSAGVYVQRPMSKRLRLTIGFQYTYMSTNTTIGKLVAQTTNVNMGSTSSTFVDQYYTSADFQRSQTSVGPTAIPRDSVFITQKYTSRFHAFEIPVLLNWQINKGRRLPPFVLDAGLSLLYMQTINSLHYDGIKDIYYKDNSLFNKTQINALLGFNAGLFQRSKLPVWIGPSLRYSLTGLVKKEVSKGQFLWSAGINVRVGLNRLF